MSIFLVAAQSAAACRVCTPSCTPKLGQERPLLRVFEALEKTVVVLPLAVEVPTGCPDLLRLWTHAVW